ncbi:hypothetical protein MAPG_02132 [Magnaporthiopsis poae ATCC 64411]|uniref:Uncharacterized protein n=1 Tax=Magnaporthiopsis poae (strain ATCC 64411 / 73-15) TaxID=644358 RepID=A0A0C4DQI9_MAGP6|nr:hypothetical protein MAPG_02132 [Magnaporthiopsis poae ATCC 64411]
MDARIARIPTRAEDPHRRRRVFLPAFLFSSPCLSPPQLVGEKKSLEPCVLHFADNTPPRERGILVCQMLWGSSTSGSVGFAVLVCPGVLLLVHLLLSSHQHKKFSLQSCPSRCACQSQSRCRHSQAASSLGEFPQFRHPAHKNRQWLTTLSHKTPPPRVRSALQAGGSGSVKFPEGLAQVVSSGSGTLFVMASTHGRCCNSGRCLSPPPPPLGFPLSSYCLVPSRFRQQPNTCAG